HRLGALRALGARPRPDRPLRGRPLDGRARPPELPGRDDARRRDARRAGVRPASRRLSAAPRPGRAILASRPGGCDDRPSSGGGPAPIAPQRAGLRAASPGAETPVAARQPPDDVVHRAHAETSPSQGDIPATMTQTWRQHAACRGLDPLIFYPATDEEAEDAKEV